jgi:hypothetical protein
MIAAVHFENLLFLLFIAIAFFFQLLTRAATKSNKDSSQPKPRNPNAPPPLPRARPETDEEQVRKFLEALGQPPGSAPPAPAKPRPTYQRPVVLPHVGPFESPLPPLTTRPPDLPKKVFRPKTEAPVFEVREAQPPVEPVPVATVTDPLVPQPTITMQPRTDLLDLLKTPSGLRDAIILREIFGPPRSMQPLDLVGIG